MQNYRPFLIIALVLAIAIISGILLLGSSRKQISTVAPGSQSSFPAWSKTEPAIPAQTVVTLEEFGDYQCPPCGELHPTLKQLKQQLGPNLNFIFRNLPLTTIHKNSLAAAQAAESARMQNRFWEMHDLLYENQNLWSDDVNPRTIFLKWAADLGLDTTRFARDLDSKQVKLRIEADQEAAAELGINGTPTVLVNGRQLRPEVTNAKGIQTAIEYVTSRKASPSP
jgi:protein-disulfide isomerase